MKELNFFIMRKDEIITPAVLDMVSKLQSW